MKYIIKIPNAKLAYRLFMLMEELYETPDEDILHDTEVLQMIWEQLANSKNRRIKKYLKND